MDNFVKYKEQDLIILDPATKVEQRWERLEPGIYKLRTLGGLFSKLMLAFEKYQTKDELIPFKSGVFKQVSEMVESFLSEEAKGKYKTLKMGHKMGILLYGPPGTGKTSLVEIFMGELAKTRNAICLNCTGMHTSAYSWAIEEFRKLQDNPIVIFVDEVESLINRDEASLLTFLDGSDSFDNIIFVGCTNYLNKVPARFRERKSRFKHVLEIKSLPDELYEQYIVGKIPDIKKELLAEFSFLASESALKIDELKNAVLDHFLEGMSVKEAIQNAKTYAQVEKEEKNKKRKKGEADWDKEDDDND